MKRHLLAFGCVISLSASAYAADLGGLRPAIMPVPAPELREAFSWGGGYVGVHGALVRGRSSATEITTIDDPTNPDYCGTMSSGAMTCNLNGQSHPVSSPMSAFNMIGDTWGMNMKGAAFGITAGYNWQMGNIVYGVEGDYGRLRLRGQSKPSPWSLDDTYLHTDATDYMTARLRVGYSINRLLLFATAGMASANFGSYVDDPDMKIGIMTAKTGTQFGYVFGLGAEYAITDKITVKADWLNMNFAPGKSIGYVNVTCDSSGCPPDWKMGRAGMAGDGTAGWNIKHSLNMFRMGANLKF